MTDLHDVRRDYRSAFVGYLMRRDEGPLRVAYEIGRRSVVDGLGVLKLAKIHHDVFLQVLTESPAEDTSALIDAASEFFLEVLATFDMAHKSFARESTPTGHPG